MKMNSQLGMLAQRRALSSRAQEHDFFGPMPNRLGAMPTKAGLKNWNYQHAHPSVKGSRPPHFKVLP
jgi:hypothetical protein